MKTPEPDGADEYILNGAWGMINNDPDTLNSLRAAIRDNSPWVEDTADAEVKERGCRLWQKEAHGWRLVLMDFVTEHPDLPPGTRIQNVTMTYLAAKEQDGPLVLMSDGEPQRKLAAYLYERMVGRN